MAMTLLTVTIDIATTEVFALSGPCRIRADDMVKGDSVTVYEESTTPGTYVIAVDFLTGNKVVLNSDRPSVPFEGYGNYKCLPSRADIVVGYVAG